MISLSSPGDPGSTPSHFLIQIVYFFGVLCLSTYAACYFPNGSDRNAEYDSEVYQPCNRSAEHSMCCRANDHKCRSDGLCYDAWTRLVWRESCTDPTWNSSACVKLCTSKQVFPVKMLKIWRESICADTQSSIHHRRVSQQPGQYRLYRHTLSRWQLLLRERHRG